MQLNHIKSKSTYLFRLFFLFLLTSRITFFILFPFLFACTNNLTLTTGTGALSNTIQAPSPTVGGSGNTGSFTLSRVIKDTANPTTVLDLIGDGSGSLGTLCQTPSGGAISSTSISPCSCTYSYSTSTHPNQQIDVPVTYVESNMVRCTYSTIPADATSVNISIHLTSANAYSTQVTFNFSGTGVTIDPADAKSFIQPLRYQCRDIVVVPYLFDGSIYDPIQSEDFHLTYPLDFYATNLGYAISTYANGVATDPNLIYWNCPPILNPIAYLSSSALTSFNSTNHINMNIYSKAPLSGSVSIYPPTPGIFDRSTFYLAKQATGVFNVAVDAYLAPNIITASGGTPPPIGYGAHPIPIGTGTGQETCPDTSTTIPTGFHWVKVWLFRASLNQRHYATSGSITKIQSISCNPGDSADTTGTYSPIFPGCNASLSHSGSSIAMGDLTGARLLSDRVLGTGQCVRLFDNGGSLCNSAGSGCSSTGEDYWRIQIPNTTTYPASATVGCSAATKVDPLNLCSGGDGTLKNPPFTLDVSTGDLDVNSSRYDFLFVVSPPNITLANMQDSSPSSPSMPYQPYRFYTDQDCLSSNPDFPTVSGDCAASNSINNYGLKLHDVGSNGDPPSDDPNRAGVFPVCALQPD